MAVFDVIVNNADREGAHMVPLHVGHRHGLTFHATVPLVGLMGTGEHTTSEVAALMEVARDCLSCGASRN